MNLKYNRKLLIKKIFLKCSIRMKTIMQSKNPRKNVKESVNVTEEKCWTKKWKLEIEVL